MYRINEGFAMKTIVDDRIIVATGDRAVSFSSVIVLNEVGAQVFEQLEAGKTPEEIAQKIADDYSIDLSTAAADVDKFLKKLVNDGVCSCE